MPINILAVIVAVVVSFIVGGLWYSPVLFGKLWMRLTNTTPESMQNKEMVRRSYAMNLLATIVTAVVLAILFNYANIDTPTKAISSMLLVWIGIVMPFGLNDVIFGKKSKELWLLNGGHQLLSLLVMGYIIALWK